MFPIFWNNPYLKSNGDLSTIGDEIGSGGGGGSVLEPLTVTENGTYTPGAGVDGFNRVNVNVSGGGGGGVVLETLTVTENGTYRPGVGVDGFDRVNVNVSGGGGLSFSVECMKITDFIHENALSEFDATDILFESNAEEVI